MCYNLKKVARWGAPSRLLPDQGREFVAKVNCYFFVNLFIATNCKALPWRILYTQGRRLER